MRGSRRRGVIALSVVLGMVGGASSASAARNGVILSSVGHNIWATAAHGATRLTHDSVNDALAVASPDGRLIAYARGSASGDVWIMRADGSHKRLVTPHHFAFAPGFSADGRLLGWHDESYAYGWNGVFVASLDGSGVRRADAGQGMVGERESLGPPRFRPGGGSFLTSSWDIVSGAEPLNPGLDLVDLATGVHQTLAHGDFGTSDWAPDGQRFVADATGGTVVVFGVDGHVQRVVARNAEEPVWSPDGRWILYRYSWCDESLGDRLCTIAVHPNGSGGHGIAVRGAASDWAPCTARCHPPGTVAMLRLSLRRHGAQATFRATANGRGVAGVTITLDNPNDPLGATVGPTGRDGRAPANLPATPGRWSAIGRGRGYIPVRIFYRR